MHRAENYLVQGTGEIYTFDQQWGKLVKRQCSKCVENHWHVWRIIGNDEAKGPAWNI